MGESASNIRSYIIKTEAEMIAFGRVLAPTLVAGDHLYLRGDLGMGKSVLARSIIQFHFGDIDVPSPSFALVQPYEDGDTEIWHYDLYRLEAANDLWPLGYEESAETAINIIEWPEIAQSIFPVSGLYIDLSHAPNHGETARKIDLKITGNIANKLALEELEQFT